MQGSRKGFLIFIYSRKLRGRATIQSQKQEIVVFLLSRKRTRTSENPISQSAAATRKRFPRQTSCGRNLSCRASSAEAFAEGILYFSSAATRFRTRLTWVSKPYRRDNLYTILTPFFLQGTALVVLTPSNKSAQVQNSPEPSPKTAPDHPKAYLAMF